MRAPGGGKAGIFGNVIGDDGGSDFVHLEAAVGLGNFNSAEAEFACLLQQVAGDGEVLVFDLLCVGKDLVDSKFFCGLADELMLFSEIFRREYFLGAAGLEQKAAARNLSSRNDSGSHGLTPEKLHYILGALRNYSSL